MEIILDLSSIFYTRKANGYSVEELSIKTGVSEYFINKAEKENTIDLLNLLKISVFLGLDEKDLYNYKVIK